MSLFAPLASRLQSVYKSAPLPYTASRAVSTISTRPSFLLSRPLTSSTSHPSSTRTFTSSTSTKMADKMSFLEANRHRRSIYPLNANVSISDERVHELAIEAIKTVPSAFNGQSTRMVILLNDEHRQFWEFVKEVLKPQMPEDKFPQTEKKLDGFKAGKGTILFLEDPEPVKKLQSQFAMYAAQFPTWSTQSNAMHQYVMWTALEAEGCGCNLQHYNPIIDNKAKGHWKIPMEWELQAQLVFGAPGEGARESVESKPKDQKPIEERVLIHGKN